MAEAEVSDPRRLASTSPVTGPISAAAQKFFVEDADLAPSRDLQRERQRPPPPRFDEEPYRYNGAVSDRSLVPWIVCGAVAVIGIAVGMSLYGDVSQGEAMRKKLEGQLATATTTLSAQATQITTLERARDSAAAETVARDHDEQQAVARAAALKATVTAALPGDVAREMIFTVDGKKLRIELADKLLFDDTGLALKDAGRETLGKLAAVLKKGDAAIDVVGHSDARKAPKQKGKGNDPAVESAWAASAVKAAAVARSLEDDFHIAGKRIDAVGKGATSPLARARNKAVEIVVTP